MTHSIGRRSFLAGLGAALFVAPAIVRAASLMPVKQMLPCDRWRVYSGYDILNLTPEISQFLEFRIEVAEQRMASFLAQSFHELSYRAGTGAAGGLNELFFHG